LTSAILIPNFSSLWDFVFSNPHGLFNSSFKMH